MASSSASRPPLIEVRNLSKSFPGVKALDHVRFDLMAGEVHALMGENGAGKSTLMKILAGVYRMDGGEVLLDGVAVDIQSPAHAQALAIGIIHQELHLMPHLSAAQNIFLGREPRKAGGELDCRLMYSFVHHIDRGPPCTEPKFTCRIICMRV